MSNQPVTKHVGNEPEAGLFDDSPKNNSNNYPLLQDQGNQEMNEDEDLFGGDDQQNHRPIERGYSLGGGLMPSGGLVHMDSNISNPAQNVTY